MRGLILVFLLILSSVLVSSYNIDTDEIIFVGGDTTFTVRAYYAGNMSYTGVESASYGGTIRTVYYDEEGGYVYVGGATTSRMRKYYAENLTYTGVQSASSTVPLASIVVGDYLYFGGVAGTLIKANKTTLATVDSVAYGGFIEALDYADGYIYAGGFTTRQVRKYDIATLTLQDSSSTYAGNIEDFLISGSVGYVAEGNNIREVYLSNLSDTGLTVSVGSTISQMGIDEAYIYAVGTDFLIRKYYQSNLSLDISSLSYGGRVEGIHLYDGLLYAGGDVIDTVRVYDTLDMSFTGVESASYGGSIWVVTGIKEEPAPITEYVAAGGLTTNKPIGYTNDTLALFADGDTYGNFINAMIQNDEYVYVGGESTSTIRQYYASNLSYTGVASPTYGGVILALATDNNYIYASGATTLSIRKYYKDNLTYTGIESDALGTANILRVDNENGYIYSASTTTGAQVRKYYTSNLTLIATYNYGDTVGGMDLEDNGARLFVVGQGGTTTTRQVRSINTSTMTVISTATGESSASRVLRISPDGETFFLGGDDATLKQYYYNLTLLATYPSYGGSIRSIAANPADTLVYVGGATTRTVRAYYTNNATYTAVESANYGGTINALEYINLVPPASQVSFSFISAWDAREVAGISEITGQYINGTLLTGTVGVSSNGTVEPLLINGDPLLTNDTNRYDFTVSPLNNLYQTYTISNFSPSDTGVAAYTFELTPNYYFINYTYTNFTEYTGVNYTRNLRNTISYVCPSIVGESASLILEVESSNGTLTNYTNSLNCLGANTTSAYTFTNPEEDTVLISPYLYFSNSAALDEFGGNLSKTQSFTFDLDPPVVSVTIQTPGFSLTSSPTLNYTLTCTDTISPLLTYNKTYNGAQIVYTNLTSGTSNLSTPLLADGTSTYVSSCTDFFETVSQTNFSSSILRVFNLINEITGAPFNVENLTTVTVVFQNVTNVSVDLRALNVSNFTYSGNVHDTFRLNLVYSDGSIIVRDFNTDLVSSNPAPICANTDPTVHYEQFASSGTSRIFVVKSNNHNCYITADYAKFTLNEGYTARFFTIDTTYFLYTQQGTSRLYLGSLDGAVQSNINIDSLILRTRNYNLRIREEILSFERSNTLNNTLFIDYRNFNDDLVESRIIIYDGDDNVLLDITDTLNPAEISIQFDYNTLNLSEDELLKVEVEKTTATGATSTLTQYFNLTGQSGGIQPLFAAFAAVIVFMFLISIVTPSSAFGWWGAMGAFIVIGILAASVATWWINLLLVTMIIILLFIMLNFSKRSGLGGIV